MGQRLEVQRWTAEYFGTQFSKVDPDDILGSIRCEGDDADEFLKAFAIRFGIDMSQFNPWHHYDADEPPLYRRYRPVTAEGEPLSDLPIGFRELEAAAEVGHWNVSYGGRELRHYNLLWRLVGLFGVVLATAVLLAVLYSAF
jgi:hypothetical protein